MAAMVGTVEPPKGKRLVQTLGSMNVCMLYIIVTEHGLLRVTFSPLSSGTLNGDWGVARTNWEGVCLDLGVLVTFSPLSSGTLNGDWGVARTNWEGVCLDLGVLVTFSPLSSGTLNGDWGVARTNW